MSERYREWLLQSLKATGKSQSGLARHMGVSQSAANRWANGKTRLKAEDLPRIADYLGVPLPNVGSSVASVTLAQPTLASVPVRGFVVEGYWIEAGAMSNRQASVAVVPNPHFGLSDHYALETSIHPDEPDIAHKTYLCIKFDALDRQLRPGDRVHLRAPRGGVPHETIRYVARTASGLVISTRNNGEGDPQPLVMDHVVGLVVGVNIEYRV